MCKPLLIRVALPPSRCVRGEGEESGLLQHHANISFFGAFASRQSPSPSLTPPPSVLLYCPPRPFQVTRPRPPPPPTLFGSANCEMRIVHPNPIRSRVTIQINLANRSFARPLAARTGSGKNCNYGWSRVDFLKWLAAVVPLAGGGRQRHEVLLQHLCRRRLCVTLYLAPESFRASSSPLHQVFKRQICRRRSRIRS